MKLLRSLILVFCVLVYPLFVFWFSREIEFFLLPKQADGKEILAVMVTLIGLPFIAWQAISASDRAKTSKEEHITNRINKAVEQLCAKEHIESRIGGLYALERIAQDSERDHITIMKIICAYVRQNAKAHQSNTDDTYRPQADIQTAILILGHRWEWESRLEYEASKKYQLFLPDTNLQRMDLEGSNLSKAAMNKTEFNFSYLEKADLSGALLMGANFQSTFLKECKLDYAALRFADFSGANGLSLEMLNKARGVKSGYGKTLLPDNIKELPTEWFDAKEAEMDSKELRDAYEEYWRKDNPHVY